MAEQRHWIDNVADVISGRVYNTLVSLQNKDKEMTEKMTQNEQTILNAAQKIRDNTDRLTSAIDSLKAKIASQPTVTAEDLSDEFQVLNEALAGLGNIGADLTPAPAGTPADGSTGTQAGEGQPTTGPISHGENIPTPLGSPTDAGVPTEVVAPGVPPTEVPTTPLAENATEEAGATGTPVEPDTSEVEDETDEGPVTSLPEQPGVDRDTAPAPTTEVLERETEETVPDDDGDVEDIVDDDDDPVEETPTQPSTEGDGTTWE